LSTQWSALVELSPGSIDLIGDVHGELLPLIELLRLLGYVHIDPADGQSPSHPQQRRLLFLGDYIDRGPDSPGVVRLVQHLVDSGIALALMGNHDLNAAEGRRKRENAWLFGHKPLHAAERAVANQGERDRIIAFLRTLPLAAARADLRAVHACWDDASIAALATCGDPVLGIEGFRQVLSLRHGDEDSTPIAALLHQNENPLKVITSGPEMAAPAPFFAGGRMRSEARRAWWNDYDANIMVVFGHYWRIPSPTLQKNDGLFPAGPLNATLGSGNAMCIDYSVGSRASERLICTPPDKITGRLAALRWPQRELVFDNGERMGLLSPQS